jgi:TolA-binding protein
VTALLTLAFQCSELMELVDSHRREIDLLSKRIEDLQKQMSDQQQQYEALQMQIQTRESVSERLPTEGAIPVPLDAPVAPVVSASHITLHPTT